MSESPIIDIGANLTHPDLHPNIRQIIQQMDVLI